MLYNSEAFIKYLTYLVINNSADTNLLNESETIKKKLFEKGNLDNFIKSIVIQLQDLINNNEIELKIIYNEISIVYMYIYRIKVA